MDAEVVVVGGGVAGSATTLHLARRGHEVLVVDRATMPREKVCGEGLMPHGVSALRRLGVEPSAHGVPFRGIRYAAGGVVAEGRFPGDTPGYGLRRYRLDAALQELVAAHPRVELRSGVTVRKVVGEAGRMEVVTRRQTLRCRAVVGADGLHSKVRRQLGLHRPRPGRPRYGLRGHVRLAKGVPCPTTVDVHVVDGAELYVTPTAAHEVNIAVLAEGDTMRELAGDLGGGWRRLATASPAVAALLDGSTEQSRPAAIGPLRQSPSDTVADSALLVGDAAGFVDAITGEGMSLTLLDAEIAGDVLSSCLRRGRLRRGDLRAYARERARTHWQLTALTEAILWGIRVRPLARHVVRNLARHPEVFGDLLAVNTGRAPLWSLGIGGLRRALVR